jgi:hypothetical protein
MLTEMNLRDWKTRRFDCGSLLASGVELLRIEAPGKFERKCRMVFWMKVAWPALLSQHLRGTLMVSSAEFSRRLENLKTQIFAIRGEGRS